MFKKNSSIKKTFGKSISILIVLMMLLALLSTITTGTIFKRNNEIDKLSTEKTLLKSVKTIMNDKFANIYQKLRSFSDKIKEKTNKLDIQTNSFSSETNDNIETSSLSSLFSFYTNYDGFEKTSNLKLFGETKIDIDGDSKKDIGASLKIYPGIVSPFALSINYKLSIRQLSGFNDLEDDAYFKAMSQFSFPGLLSKKLSGDQIEFGYESPENEVIPDKCDVTYKLVPHIFKIGKTPDHIFKIQPSSDAEGSSDLNLTFSVTESDDSSKVYTKVSYEPVVDTELKFKRSRNSGTSLIKYERTVSSETKIDLYFSYSKNGNETCAYALDFADYISFSLKLGKQGKIEFISDASIGEIGICDDIQNPESKVYFSDMFTTAKLEWARDPFLFLTKGNFNASVYTQGDGVSFNAHLVGNSGGTANISIIPDSNIINSSLELDLSDGYFRFNRNEFDISVTFSVSILDNQIGSFLSTLWGSFDIARLVDSPFEILFDSFSNGDMEIYLSGKSFELSEVDITGFSQKIGGSFSFSMDSLLKENAGFIRFNLTVEQKNNNLSGYCRFDIANGVKINDLSLRFNGFEFDREDIDTTRTCTRWYNFSVNVTIVDWHVASDLSHGYVLIGGGSAAYYSFDSSYWDSEDVLVGRVAGTIRLKTVGDVFNISWRTVNGSTVLSLDGSGVAELYNFEFWLKDKVDVSIPQISGGFSINASGNTSELVLTLEEGNIMFDLSVDKISIDNLMGISLHASIDAYIDMDASASIIFTRNGSDKNIEVDVNSDLHSTTNIAISNVSFSLAIPGTWVGVDLDVSFVGGGYININYSNNTLLADAVVYGSYIFINQISVDSSSGALIMLAQSVYIYGTINISLDEQGLLTINTENEISIESFTFGPLSEDGSTPPGYAFGRDISGSVGGGSIILGGPHLITLDGIWNVGNLLVDIQPGGTSPTEITNVTINGFISLDNANIDFINFLYVLLQAEAHAPTTITLDLLTGVEIILEPGYVNFLYQAPAIINGYTTGWVTIKGPNMRTIRFGGYLDLQIEYNLASYVTINAKISGGIIIDEFIRIVGDIDGLIDVSWDLNQNNGTITISDFNLDINATVDAHIWIKPSEEEGWIPIIPFYSSPNVLILSGTSTSDTRQIKTSSTTTSVAFNIWYCPPFGVNDSYSGYTYVYNFSWGDGNYTEVETNKTELSFRHTYELDESFLIDPNNIAIYDCDVSVSIKDTTFETVEDSVTVEIIPRTQLTMIPPSGVIGTGLYLNYEDVEEDGKIHKSFKLKNNGPEGHDVNWRSIFRSFGGDDAYELWDTNNWTVEPDNGALDTNETVVVNLSFYPPADHADHFNKLGDTMFLIIRDEFYLGQEAIEFFIYDGSVLLQPRTRTTSSDKKSGIHFPKLDPGETISSVFFIRNIGREPLNWTIEPPENLTWEFEYNNDDPIPVGGGAQVAFSVTAPNINGSTERYEIKVVNTDNTSDYDVVDVVVRTKGKSNNSNGNTQVQVTGENVSIRIGGSNEINIDKFIYEINGVSGEIEGHFIFDANDSYVFINFTQGNILRTFSVDGSAEFTIQGFRFRHGDNISVEVSKVITGGIHWYEGKAGNFTLAVDDTFTDIDIDVSFNQTFTNFSLAGNIDVDVKGNSDGKIWINWDFNNDTKNITVDGDLFRVYEMDINITDLQISVNNFTFASSFIHINRSLYFSFNETGIQIETGGLLEFEGIYFDLDLNGNNLQIFTDGNLDVLINGKVSFIFHEEEDKFCIHTDGYLYVGGDLYAIINDFHIKIKGNITMSGDWNICYWPD